jgi:hypothetical protein
VIQEPGEFLKRPSANEEIHLWQFFFQNLPITLGKASGDDEEMTTALLFITDQPKNGLDCFSCSILNKGAGVDDDYLSLRRIRSKKIPFFGEKAEDHFGID